MEVVVKLKFITPCLGSIRRPDRDLFQRNADNEIIFMPSSWKVVFKFGAQALNKFFKEVEGIRPDPIVKGTVGVFKRHYSKTEFKEHEAFLPDTEISVKYWLPNEISVDTFKELLNVSGKYIGFSPYGHSQDYGRFAVVSVEPTQRTYCNNQEVR